MAQPSPAIDPQTLESLLDLGGAELRAALCAQLRADFTRLSQAMSSDNAASVARAAHEMKGLAATAGADRLADMARHLDHDALNLPQDARAVLVSALQRETDRVIATLDSVSKRSLPA